MYWMFAREPDREPAPTSKAADKSVRPTLA
jgi:hypothetical protein